MSQNGQKKHKKALERAKRVKAKMVKRRHAHDVAKKEEKRLSDLQRRIDKSERLAALGLVPKGSDKFNNLIQKLPKTEEEKKKDMVQTLQKNAEMLKLLEEQHDAELKCVEEYKKKMQEAAAQNQETEETAEKPSLARFKGKFQEASPTNKGRIYGGKKKFGGSADCQFTPNEC